MLEHTPDKVPLDLVIFCLVFNIAEVQVLVGVLLLVHNVWESECLMDSAKLWPEACLSWGLQALAGRLAQCGWPGADFDQKLIENVGIEPVQRFPNSYGPVVAWVCSIPPFENGGDKGRAAGGVWQHAGGYQISVCRILGGNSCGWNIWGQPTPFYWPQTRLSSQCHIAWALHRWLASILQDAVPDTAATPQSHRLDIC